MLNRRTLCVLILLAGACVAYAGVPTPLTTTRVISGVTRPLFVTAPPGDYARIFVVEQRGVPAATSARILVYSRSNFALLDTFLVVTGLSTGNEQGLLGLAFDPNYLTNGRFYINFSNSAQSGATVIRRYIDSNPCDNVHTDAPGSPNTVLTVAQPFTNHNGGWTAFGPDGYLYIAMGDGGSANDPGNRAQNINELLGKILRIDVSGATGYTNPPDNPYVGVAGADEVWHIGVRNPWRCSFDRQTGDLYIGDVGQNVWEEISFQPAHTLGTLPGQAGYQGRRNYGWRCMEANNCTGLTGCTCDINCTAAILTCPIHQYDHSLSRCSVTGGYVYRGARITDLQGTYFFADYLCTGAQAPIYSFVYTGTPNPPVTNRTAELAPGGGLTINTITSFGEDAAGDLYITDQGGEVFRITAASCIGTSLAVTTPPQNQTVCVGDTAVFTVATSSPTGPARYRWRKGCTPLNVPDSNTLTLTNVQPSDAGSYSVIIEDNCNTAISANAVLTVLDDPAIPGGGQPASQTVCVGANVSFSVTATGGALNYDWQRNNVSLGAPNSPTLNLTNVQTGDAGNYTVVVTNICGQVTSSIATLTVNQQPGISDQPDGQTVCIGDNANFSVTASGGGLSYDWRRNNVSIGAPNSPTLSLANVQPADAGDYTVVVSNNCGQTPSEVATLVVAAAPAILQHPTQQYACEGGEATFSVSASGPGLSYDWRKDKASLGAPDSPTLNLTNVQESDEGDYDVVITNDCGSQISDPASLTVSPTQPVGDIDGNCALTAADRTAFVNVLVGVDTNPDHVQAADLDDSGTADGNDIQLFIALPVPP